MANQDWIYETSAPILAASAAAGLSGTEANQMDNLAWIAAKHKELDNMTEDASKAAFAKLDIPVQEALKSFYGFTKYNPEQGPSNPIAWAQEKGSEILGFASDKIGGYTNFITNWYRMARISDNPAEFFSMDTWNKAWDGEKLFDQSIEAQINKAYDPNLVRIGKRIAMGENFGEILSSLKTSEEYAAFMQFQNGSVMAMNVLDDFNDARFSWGRDIAKLFFLNPEIGKDNGGIQGKLFNFVSGTFDIIGDIALDPLTYAAAPFKAVQGARFGLLQILKSEANILEGGTGAVSFAQKAASNIPGMKFGVDAAFENKNVRAVFDEVGGLITKSRSAKSSAERAQAMQQLKDKYSFFTDNTIIELGKAGVKDADTAKAFFKDADKLNSIITGKVGSMQNMLPRATTSVAVKRGIRDMTRAVTEKTVGNFLKTYNINKAAFVQGGNAIIDALEKGNALQGVTDISSPLGMTSKNVSSKGLDRFSRMFDRAIIDNGVYVGGQDELGREVATKSASTVYTLARAVLPKYHSQMVANAYSAAKDEASRIKILEGILDTVAGELGLLATPAGKRQYDEIMRAFKTPIYGEETVIGKDVAASGIMGNPASVPAVYDPSTVNTVGRSLAVHQLAEQRFIPHLKELTDLVERNPLIQGISTTLHGKVVQTATDYWSAANLLPRLGLRSVIDESIFHYLTLPVALLPKVIEGYVGSISRRIVTSEEKYVKSWFSYRGPSGKRGKLTQEKDIGAAARLFGKFFVNMTEEEAKLAMVDVKAASDIIQRNLMTSRIGKLVFSEKDASYLAQSVAHGFTREIEEMSEGVNKAVSQGSPTATRTTYAKENYNINVRDAEKEIGAKLGGKPIVIHNNSNSFNLNMLVQLSNRVDRNGMIGRLAVQNIEDPAKAVKEIADYLAGRGAYAKGDGPKIWGRFERSRFQTHEQAATDMYLHVRTVLQNDAGELNTNLINKIRTVDPATGKVTISAREIGLDDLNEVSDMLPKKILGYEPVIEAPRGLGIINALVDRGFQVADRQVATLSREPVYTAYYLHFRNQLAKTEEQQMQKLIAGGMDADLAKATVEARYTFIGNELAMNRTLGFIDNPNVRSNFAMNTRNLARYYRANEDFARRAARAVSPQSLVRLRMASEGIDHAGFIHEDQNGDKYFFIPIDGITSTLYSGVIKLFTGESPKEVIPLALTGKIKMLSPSIDPESAMPTFSSPLMAVGFSLIKNIIPADYLNPVERALFGQYGQNRDLYDAITPAALRKSLEVIGATVDNQMTEQVISASMKAAAFYTANGMAPGPEATASEREEFRLSVIATARNIVAVRNLLGILSPVSPQLSETADVPSALLDEGFVSFKTEFQQLVKAEIAKGTPNAYNEAIMKWTRINPGRLVYTVSETETNKVGVVQKTKEAVEWIQRNEGIAKKYPQGSVFLLPQFGDFDMTAYAFLKAEGYQKSKPLEKYFEEIANVRAENEYYGLRKEYADKIAIAPTQTEASNLAREYEQRRQMFLENKPYFVLSQEGNAGNQAKIDALTDLRNLLKSGDVPMDNTANTLLKMVDEYDKYANLISSITNNTSAANRYKSLLVNDAVYNLQKIAGGNANALLLCNDILSKLLGQ